MRLIITKYFIFTVTVSLLALMGLNKSVAEEQGWKSNIALGFNLSRGNTTNMLFNADLAIEKNGTANEFKMGVSIAYGETGDHATEENGKLDAQYNRLLTKKTYLYLKGDVARNEIAKLDYRFVTGPGIGRYFVKTDNQTLSIELGASYVEGKEEASDDMSTEADDAIALRFAQKYKGMISNAAKVWESAEYLPQCDDFDIYLLNSEVGIETAINSRLSLRLVVQDTYDSDPAPGVKNNDIVIKSALVCNL